MKRLLHALLGVAVLAGCNSDDEFDATVPTNIAAVKGGGQFGDAGAPLTDSLTVIITNLKGDPVPGITVEWTVLSGGGSINSSEVTTSDNGTAQVMYVVGPLEGEQRVQARAGSLSGSPVTFSVIGRGDQGGGGGGGGGTPIP